MLDKILHGYTKGEFFALMLVVFFGVVALILALTNAHLTQTQLFIEFWWVWLGMIVTLVFVILVVFRD